MTAARVVVGLVSVAIAVAARYYVSRSSRAAAVYGLVVAVGYVVGCAIFPTQSKPAPRLARMYITPPAVDGHPGDTVQLCLHQVFADSSRATLPEGCQ